MNSNTYFDLTIGEFREQFKDEQFYCGLINDIHITVSPLFSRDRLNLLNVILSVALPTLNIDKRDCLLIGLTDFTNKPNFAHGVSFEFIDGKLPRCFGVTMNISATHEQMIYIMAHELVHVEQMSQNRLKMLEQGIVKYDGIIYSDPVSSNEEYESLPWEVEATKRGLELTDQIIDFVKQTIMEKRSA